MKRNEGIYRPLQPQMLWFDKVQSKVFETKASNLNKLWGHVTNYYKKLW